jgi:hypothetical protein
MIKNGRINCRKVPTIPAKKNDKTTTVIDTTTPNTK